MLAEVKIINLGGASLPREDVQNPSIQGGSWTSASTNWMNLLRQGGDSLGSGRGAVIRKSDLGDYRGMITSATTAGPNVRTWKGQDDSSGPTVEWGNRWHQGVQVLATAGETFLPTNITVTSQAFTKNGPSGTLQTASFASLNNFKLVLNADNSVASIQNSNLPASNFIYGGIGRSVGMFAAVGVQTVQQRLDATANALWSQEYHFVCSVTVRYTPSGGGPLVTQTSTWEVNRPRPMFQISEEGLTLSGAVAGKTYFIQNSSNLSDWENMQAVISNGEPLTIPIPHKENLTLHPKQFYRVSQGE